MSDGTIEADTGAIDRELRLLGVDVAPEDLRVETLLHNAKNTITEGIWRVRAGDFHAVLKVVAFRPGGDPHWQPSTSPSAWNYWRREADAYRSGLVDVFQPHGVRGPRSLQVVDRDEETIAIWMEDVSGRPGAQIDAASMRDVSYRLGRAQGAWTLRGDPLPEWCSRRFLRDYTGSKTLGWQLLDDDAGWEHPLVARCFPEALREGAVGLRRDREWLLRVMEHLPRTLAHLDIWPNNLIFADDGDVVLVDWAFVGDGTLGEDIGNLVPDAVFDRFVPAADLPELADIALEAYIEGLRAVGWEEDRRLVELGFYASAIKYDWLVPLLLERAPEQQLDYGGLIPVGPEERYRERGQALLELTRWAEKAKALVRDDPSLLDGVRADAPRRSAVPSPPPR